MAVRSKVKVLVIGICLIVLGVIVACGESATPTGAPAATDTPDAGATATPTGATATPGTGATPTATPAAATATPSGMVMPTGTLQVGITDMGPINFSIKNQAYVSLLVDTTVNAESMFATSPDGLSIPMLVKDWEVDSTGLVYTFQLQDGVPWIDSTGQGRDFGNFMGWWVRGCQREVPRCVPSRPRSLQVPRFSQRLSQIAKPERLIWLTS